MGKSVFIIGTDTDCGKTIVTAALAASLKNKGIDVGVMKPFESAGTDSQFLKEASASSDPIEEINPYHFEEPLAPAVAAERAGVTPSFDVILKLFQQLQQQHDRLLIEGAGGLLVPLIAQQTHIDLLKLLKVPVLLVARRGLGTINHTLLTLNALQAAHIDCLAVVLNERTTDNSLAVQTNAAILRKLTSIPIIDPFPHLKDPHNRQELIQAVPTELQEIVLQYS